MDGRWETPVSAVTVLFKPSCSDGAVQGRAVIVLVMGSVYSMWGCSETPADGQDRWIGGGRLHSGTHFVQVKYGLRTITDRIRFLAGHATQFLNVLYL